MSTPESWADHTRQHHADFIEEHAASEAPIDITTEGLFAIVISRVPERDRSRGQPKAIERFGASESPYTPARVHPVCSMPCTRVLQHSQMLEGMQKTQACGGQVCCKGSG